MYILNQGITGFLLENPVQIVSIHMNGILNILDRYKEIFGNAPDYVITGFHMMKKDGEHTEEEKAVIVQTARELSQMNTVFYSGHCTGIPAFEIMKEIMGDQPIALHSGEVIR